LNVNSQNGISSNDIQEMTSIDKERYPSNDQPPKTEVAPYACNLKEVILSNGMTKK
jgi:hypothetical protein